MGARGTYSQGHNYLYNSFYKSLNRKENPFNGRFKKNKGAKIKKITLKNKYFNKKFKNRNYTGGSPSVRKIF